jgi:hypothetical protein
MADNRYPCTTFSDADILALKPAMKVGVLATVDPQGLPHLTMISTLMACGASEVAWGQFMEGQSKAFVRQNPRTAFLIMTLDRQIWRGKADFQRTAAAGPEYDFYNNTPLFRYNAYFGVHTVFYMSLLAHTGRLALPMNRVAFAAVQTLLARSLSPRREAKAVLNPWTCGFFNKIDNLKFLSYVGADGYPVIIPAIQAQALDRQRIVFSLGAFGGELAQIPAGAPLAVFGLALSMEDVLVRGTFQGVRRMCGVRCGVVEVDWVYNSMPPVPGQIYPPLELKPVREF